MYGTLGLWYEDRGHPGSEEPRADIHVNLWRDLGHKVNYFDFGILLKDISNISKIFLYIPTKVKKDQIYDLGISMKENNTLNAVFNELYNIEHEQDRYFVVSETDRSKAKRKIVHEICVEDDIYINNLDIFDGNRGTIISFSCELMKRLSSSDINTDAEDKKYHYLRIRILLDKSSKNIFTSDDNSSDIGFSISQNTTETTEFRFNERRSYPPDVLSRSLQGKNFHIDGVYYFLIRNKSYHLKHQHQNFNKIRFLEPKIWDRYASYGNSSGKILRLNQSMMIYQWKSLSENGVKDFIAYASFENSRLKILSYIIVLLAFGGVGGAVLNIMIDYMKIRFVSNNITSVLLTITHRPESKSTIYDIVIDIRRNLLSLIILFIIALSPIIFFSLKKFLYALIERILNRALDRRMD